MPTLSTRLEFRRADFGRADLDETEEFTFSDLVELNNVNGKNIAQTNPHRGRYMMRFVNALVNQLREIVEKGCLENKSNQD